MLRHWLLLGALMVAPAGAASSPALLAIMQGELQRCQHQLAHKAPPGPYFMSYAVNDDQQVEISGMNGGLILDNDSHTRSLDVDVRVGSYQLDNTHLNTAMFSIPNLGFPLGDDPVAWRSAFFLPTEQAWRSATEALAAIQTNQALSVAQPDTPADFSQEPPSHYDGPVVHLQVDRARWQGEIGRLAAEFLRYPDIQMSQVSFNAQARQQWFTNTDDSAVHCGELSSRVDMAAMAQADDGMPIVRSVSVQCREVEHLPAEAVFDSMVGQVVHDVEALRKAPVMEPYEGPAILSGRAAGVFFHEIFGHRIEGHRQKGEQAGQTFTHRVGQAVLPSFISVVDDPTMLTFHDTDLNGSYQYDDEGVEARPVTVVDHGVLKNFLMSRSPVTGFEHSNGHGRRAPGHRAVGRQGNLIVSSTEGCSDAELRRRLIELCRQQGKPFGILIDDVNGGFTMTEGEAPQAFEVQPSMVYRVYVDGRPDELVRGVALIGTPLTAFSRIVACGDHQEVFNGICGAESGPVPVSAVSPALLVEQIELQRQPQSDQRPPILPPPTEDKP